MVEQHRQAAHKPSAGNGSDRSFGLVFAAVFSLVGLFPLIHHHPVRMWAIAGAAAFLILALVAPRVLAVPNRLWMRLGLLLNQLVSPIALALLFYGVVMPTGLLMRLFGKDSLKLKFERQAESYWTVRTPPGPSADSLKNQF